MSASTTSDAPSPERAPRPRRHSIAEKIGAIGQNRAAALLLLIATVVAVVWANVAHGAYEAFWEMELTVGLGDIRLDFTLHALVNDALMAIFFFHRGPRSAARVRHR